MSGGTTFRSSRGGPGGKPTACSRRRTNAGNSSVRPTRSIFSSLCLARASIAASAGVLWASAAMRRASSRSISPASKAATTCLEVVLHAEELGLVVSHVTSKTDVLSELVDAAYAPRSKQLVIGVARFPLQELPYGDRPLHRIAQDGRDRGPGKQPDHGVEEMPEHDLGGPEIRQLPEEVGRQLHPHHLRSAGDRLEVVLNRRAAGPRNVNERQTSLRQPSPGLGGAVPAAACRAICAQAMRRVASQCGEGLPHSARERRQVRGRSRRSASPPARRGLRRHPGPGRAWPQPSDAG